MAERFTEGASGFLRGQLLDQAGAAVDSGVLTAATLTLYDVETTTIINARDAQDILGSGSGANDVTYQTNGYFRLDLQAATPGSSPEYLGDNAIITERRQIERHRAQFRFEWSSGAFVHEIEIEVVNLRSAA